MTTRSMPYESDTSTQLRELVPRALLPAKYTARTQLVSWLKRIEYVHVRDVVTRNDGKRYYVMDVYVERTHSNIPTHRPQERGNSHSRPLRPPHTTTERRFTDFSTLLSDLYYLAHESHGLVPCSFCVAFVDFVFADKQTPSLVHKWLHSDASVCARLTQCVNSLLELTQRVKTREDQCGCIGQLRAPEILSRFLTGHEGSTGSPFARATDLSVGGTAGGT